MSLFGGVVATCVWSWSGINNRFYAGYKPEDFIGKIATVCQAGNNCNVELVALKRFYLAYLVLCFSICFRYVFFGCLVNLAGHVWENIVGIAHWWSQLQAKKPQWAWWIWRGQLDATSHRWNGDIVSTLCQQHVQIIWLSTSMGSKFISNPRNFTIANGK